MLENRTNRKPDSKPTFDELSIARAENEGMFRKTIISTFEPGRIYALPKQKK
jgi:hypothetical protein